MSTEPSSLPPPLTVDERLAARIAELEREIEARRRSAAGEPRNDATSEQQPSSSCPDVLQYCFILLIVLVFLIPAILVVGLICVVPVLSACICAVCYKIGELEEATPQIILDSSFLHYMTHEPPLRQHELTVEEIEERLIVKRVVVILDGGDEEEAPAIADTTAIYKIQSQQHCEICLEPFLMNEHVACSNNCSHVFHKHCILTWLSKQKSTCPCCRSVFLSEEETNNIIPELEDHVDDNHNDEITTEQHDIESPPEIELTTIQQQHHDDDDEANSCEAAANNDETGAEEQEHTV